MTALLAAVAPASAGPVPCAAPTAQDEWPTFGRDLANTRTQEHPGDISPATTPTLQPVWSFTTGAAANIFSDLNGTPIVSGGCVYLNTAGGDVVALDANDGTVVWRHHVPLDPETVAGLGGTFVSSPAVTSDAVLTLVNQVDSPYVLALSRTPGADGAAQVLWRSEPIVEGAGYYTNATAVVTNGLLLAGFSPAEGDPDERGGIAIFDAGTGQLLKRVYSIPQDAFDNGYAGGGIWTAPAVDEEHGYAYAGTSNPYSKKIEHDNTNAILKIDVDPARPSFGEVVGSYKGLIEQYDPALREAVDPLCEAAGEDPNLQLIVGDSAPCLQLDLDFGSPPNLFRDSAGRLIVGDLQKAGVYHAVDANSMEPAWKATVGGSCAACNAAAWASHSEAVVGASSPGGAMLSLAGDDGAVQWASPIADGTHYQSTSIAGGVVFTVDNVGNLLAWNEASGLPLLRRPLQTDAGESAVGVSSSGVAIASGMVIAAAGNDVVAYAPAGLG
ncbi:MAG TPA: PQQ-binding-like beta-propeller repeat protein [Nocardioides sp.]|nr:PQQ-binding-like beta-propeller repeat protein [Nocardioides sp.]